MNDQSTMGTLELNSPESGGAPMGEPPGSVSRADESSHEHPSPRQYVLIAVVLCVVTAVEVAASYMEDIPSNVLIAMLMGLAAVKFFLVVSWFMHLRTDILMFRRVFLVGLVGASVIYAIVFATFASTLLS